MKTVMLKNIVISSILAASTCFAMLGPANAASNHTEQHRKDKITVNKSNAAKTKAKVITETSQNHKSNKISKINQKSKAVTPKKTTTHQTSKSKKVVAEQKAKNVKNAQQDKHRKG